MAIDVRQNYQIVMMRAQALANARWLTIASGAGSRRMCPQPATSNTMHGRDPYAPGSRPIPGKELLASTFVELDLAAADAVDVADEAIDRAGYMLEEQVRNQLRTRVNSDVPPALEAGNGSRIEAVLLLNAKGPIRVRDTHTHGTSKIRLDFDLLLRVIEEPSMQKNVAEMLVPQVSVLVAAAVDACQVGRSPRVLMAHGDIATGKMGQTNICVLIGVGTDYGSQVAQIGQQLIAQAGNDNGASTTGPEGAP